MTDTRPNPVEDALYSALDITYYPVSDSQKYRQIATLFYQKYCELVRFDNENRWRLKDRQPELAMEPSLTELDLALFRRCHRLCSKEAIADGIPQIVKDDPIGRYKAIKEALWLSHLCPPFNPEDYTKGKRASHRSSAELAIEELLEEIEPPANSIQPKFVSPADPTVPETGPYTPD